MNRNRCRDLEPNSRLNSGNLAEERVGELLELDGSRISKENPLEQLTWTHRSSQSLNQQPGNMHGTDIDPLHISM